MSTRDKEDNRLLGMYDAIHIFNPMNFDEGSQLKRIFNRDSREIAKRLARLRPASISNQSTIWRQIENIIHKIITREKYKEYRELIIENLINGLEEMYLNGNWLK